MLALFTSLALVVSPAPTGEPTPSPAPPEVHPDPFDLALGAGDEAFAARDDPARLGAALARYREALTLRPGDESALLALCRAEAFRARAVPEEALPAWREVTKDAEQALRTAAPGFAAALARGEDPVRAAEAVEAPAAEPLYWLALGTLGLGQARGMAATLAVKEVARGLMERAAHLDERVDHGGPYRALGAWFAALPSAAGGGAEAAGRAFARARALAPDYELTNLLEAQTLAVLLQDRARFEALLGEVLAFDETRAPEIAPENRLAKKLAQDLLAREDRLF
ncbi:MAG TPA: TRAP transporter TatT component family protein [Anaeromyxobacteraceae bacterium]|nr:TRAP transporter TatT component family protein [Anaeromyxobacteraceae bacterium]